jgi:hypothetical protein
MLLVFHGFFQRTKCFHKINIGKMCLVRFIYVVENGNQS